MEVLYQTLWAGHGCTAIAAKVAALAIAATAVTAVILIVILRIAIRRGSARPVAWRWPAAGLGALIVGIILFAAVDGRTTHRISVAADGLVFEGCDGLSPSSEAVAFREVTGAAHRMRRARGRSGGQVDEVVLTLRDAGETRIIPLSTDPATLNPAALRRVMPAAVIEAYRDSLAQRGRALPPSF